MRSRVGFTGYRLHDERIAQSHGKGSMRTIKYELKDTRDVTGLRDAVGKAIFSDYQRLYGPLNLPDFLQTERTPSVLEFWLLSLSLGLFYGTSRDKVESEFAAYKSRRTAWQIAFQSIEPKLRDLLDEGAWISFLIEHQRPGQKSLEQFAAKSIQKILRKEPSSEEQALLRPIIEQLAAEYTTQSDKTQFKAQLFGVDAPQVEARELDLTWTIDPDAAIAEWSMGDEPTKLIEDVLGRYERVFGKGDPRIATAMGVGNNGGYLNNILNTASSYLSQGKADQVAAQIAEVCEYSKSQEKEVARRLQILADYVRQLGTPRLVATWADYRSMFNGTLESWYSNRERLQKTVDEQLVEVRSALEQLTEVLREYKAQSEPSLTIAEELRRTIDEVHGNDNTISQEESATLRLLQRELRSELNARSQKNVRKDARLSQINTILKKDIQSSPFFFGISQRRRYTDLINAKAEAVQQLTALRVLWDWLSSQATAVSLIDRQVDALAMSATRAEHPRLVTLYTNIERLLETSFSKRTQRSRYFLSGYEHQTGLQKLQYKPVMLRDIVAVFQDSKILEATIQQPSEEYLLRDLTQLSRTLLAAAIASLPDETRYDISSIAHLLTPRQHILLERMGNERRVSKDILRILQSYMHAALSGCAALMSRREVVVRATVQAVNGSQTICATAMATSRKGHTSRRYYYHFPKLKDSDAVSQEVSLAQKSYNFGAADFKTKSQTVPVLGVSSSRYQVQFMEWLVGNIKKRKNTLQAGGAFSVAEYTATIDWQEARPRILHTEDMRVYTSQPFTIIPREEPRIIAPTDSPRFIGVDVGEYGFAYMVIEVHKNRAKKVASGFISEPGHRQLGARVRQLRETHVRATFSSPDNRLARIRESVTGAYRNQLASLELTYNATPVFEMSISAFDNSSEIIRLHDAIKRADVKLKGNTLQNKQAWGILSRDQHHWAKEVVAAGTSQTCSKCNRWARKFITDNAAYLLTPHPTIGRLSVTTLDNGAQAVAFLDNPHIQSVTGKDLKAAIYKAMLPTIEGVALQLVDKKTLGDTKEWVKKRGNKAIYICPFTDCHHLADADLQAAQNIALRGYVKQYIFEDKPSLKESEYYDALLGIDYPVVGL